MSTPVGRLTTATRRTEEIGSTPLELTSSERLRTERSCVPRDIVSVGDTLLFGRNVFLALKPETMVGDVFALYDRDLNRPPEDAVPSLLDDPAFDRELAARFRLQPPDPQTSGGDVHSRQGRKPATAGRPCSGGAREVAELRPRYRTCPVIGRRRGGPGGAPGRRRRRGSRRRPW
ncbi:hypothetical protein A4E84_36510 [Streptomyces qaidamensis]|uniref:DUF3686 domain-containing protein n=1 Tax=Streptomyces qaidamensis TaxID=1783515 RepID=A0A143CAN6_9ACTN|nr:DNA repair ATPase [Streptomyces qaidamensis]AMW14506.1 hypothetical protein A4E84_36510 [Streptomyces qaidamensis]